MRLVWVRARQAFSDKWGAAHSVGEFFQVDAINAVLMKVGRKVDYARKPALRQTEPTQPAPKRRGRPPKSANLEATIVAPAGTPMTEDAVRKLRESWNRPTSETVQTAVVISDD